MKVKVHPLFLLLLAAAFFTGLFVQAVVIFAIVVIHELGHICVAASLGYRVRDMELLPFGGVARLEHGTLGWSPRDETAIAIAGPLNNIFLVMVAVLMYQMHFWNESMTVFFIKGNLMIAFFNLIPAFPLDGGRILRAALSRTEGYKKATEVAVAMSFVFSAILVLTGVLALAAGQLNVGVMVLGVFLALSALQARRQLRFDAVRFLDAKRRQKKTAPQPASVLAASSRISVADVIHRFGPDTYHIVYVLDDNENVIDTIGEEELIRAALEQNGYRKALVDVLPGAPRH
jgi:stage IV sporulation protein FB